MHTIGDIARWPESELGRSVRGERARTSRGGTRRGRSLSLSTEHEAKSISQETTFTRDVRDDKTPGEDAAELAAEVARLLARVRTWPAATVKLKIRWPDFTTLTRQTTLRQRSDDETRSWERPWNYSIRQEARPGGAADRRGRKWAGVSGPAAGTVGYRARVADRLAAAIDELQRQYGDKVIHRVRTHDIVHCRSVQQRQA